MKKISETLFVCSNCGNEFLKWAGQCPSCHEWNSLREVRNYGTSISQKFLKSGRQKKELVNLIKMEVKNESEQSIFSTEMKEFDRVLGKGIVRGQVVLFAGEPGIGKSTLLTQLLGKIGGLYVAGEETAEQIALRVKRLKLDKEKFDILETNSVEDIAATMERVKNVFKIMVVDSIQMMMSEKVTATPGSLSQIRESTFQLIEIAKQSGAAIFIVGHVTKDGEIAGPKILEHMVDTVLYFEGERNGELRILRVDKNRFGPTDEVGVFKMEEGGLKEISSEEVSLIDSKVSQIGSTVSLVMEGSRPMLVEVQALVTESFSPMPKRIFSGIDFNRGQLLVAVAQKVLGIPLYKEDIFLAISGGVRVNDPGADLAVIGAIYSSYKNKAFKNKIVLMGEVSLLGEVRKIRMMEKREKEVKSLGREYLKVGNINELKKLF